MTNFNIYFPTNNLSPQGWLTDFITPYIKRSNNRSDEANIFYDKKFTESAYKLLKKKFKNEAEFKDFLLRRSLVDDEKIFSLNGNCLDYLETNPILKSSEVTPEENVKYLKFMSRIKPHQQAFLQSYMKLQYGFKKDVNDKNYTFIDFPFTQKFDLDFILNSGVNYTRSEGCGIKSINVNNEFNFVTRVNSKVNIEFFIANMKILTREINEKGIPTSRDENVKKLIYGFSFLKLLENFDPAKQILRLEYGRKVADGFINYDNSTDLSIKSIIERKEKKVLFLNKIDHQFNFTQNGTISLSVTYLDLGTSAFLSDNQVIIPQSSNKMNQYENKKFQDLLKTYSDLKEEIEKTKQELLKQSKEIQEDAKNIIPKRSARSTSPARALNNLGTPEDSQVSTGVLTKRNLATLNRGAEIILKEIRNSFATIFLDTIKQQGQLFSINFKTKKDKTLYNVIANISLVKPTDGKFLSLFEINKSYDLNKYKNFVEGSGSQIEKIFPQIFNTPGNPIKSENDKAFGNIMFFPLRSLISVVYSFLNKEERIKIPRILLGNCYININGKHVSINIGDLLVERDTFQKWYYEKCLAKDRINLSFGSLMSDIMSSLVPNIILNYKTEINNCSPSEISSTVIYMDSEIDQEKKDNLYYLSDRYVLENFGKKLSLIPDKDKIPMIYFSQKNSISSNVQTPSSSNDLSEYFYNELSDIRKGVVHIKFGADGGVVKQISFSAMDDSRIRSAYAYEALANNALRIRLYYYSMNLTMFGNNLFPYNSFVCVPLSSLGLESSESDPGLSGYYMVRGTSDSINQDLTYETTADCVWQFSPENDKVKDFLNLTMADNNKITDSLSVNDNTVDEYILNKIVSTTKEKQNGIVEKDSPEKKDASKKGK